MDSQTIENGKTMAFISYLTLLGLIIALVMNSEKRNAFTSFHIRQSLGLWLTFMLLGYFIGGFDSWLISISFWIFFGVLFIYGIMTASSGNSRPVPLLGDFYQKIFGSIGK